jgi:hypothetical protein
LQYNIVKSIRANAAPSEYDESIAKDCTIYIFILEQLDLRLYCSYVSDLIKPSPRRFKNLESAKTEAHAEALLNLIQTSKSSSYLTSEITFKQNRNEPNAKYLLQSLVHRSLPVQTADEWIMHISKQQKVPKELALYTLGQKLQNIIYHLMSLIPARELSSFAQRGSPERNFVELFKAFAMAFDLELPRFELKRRSIDDYAEALYNGFIRLNIFEEMWRRIAERHPGDRSAALGDLADFILENQATTLEQQPFKSEADPVLASALESKVFAYSVAARIADYYDNVISE